MSRAEEQEQPSSAELIGAVGGKDGKESLGFSSESPPTEEYPPSPINNYFPDTLEGLEFYRNTLMKFLLELRKILKKQKESVQKYAEKLGIPWEKYVQERKKDLIKIIGWNKDEAENFTSDWEEEKFLPECTKTLTRIRWMHLYRWTVYKNIEKFYRENKNVARMKAHKPSINKLGVSAHERDSESHLQYLVNKEEDLEFREKDSCFVFNRLGVALMSERQIRALEKVVGHLLGKEEKKYAKHWTEKAIETTREVNEQYLADTPTNTLEEVTDKSKTGSSSGNSSPPADAPCPYLLAFDMLNDLRLDRRDSLSNIPGLPRDSPSDESPIDKSEEASSVPTGEGSDDEATSLEDNANRRKLYSHKAKPRRGDGNVADTEQ